MRARCVLLPYVLSLCLALAVAACARAPEQRTFTLQGQVQSLDPARKQVVVKHEEIKGFMPAMTMPYEVREARSLDGLAPGDLINAQLVVFSNGAHLTAIKKVGNDTPSSETVIAMDLKADVVLIGGTHYAGEIKKSVFTVLNQLLPDKGVLPMHCSANVGTQKDTAIFFGLSGTGKTTLSADPNRGLIGDDEHGWADQTVFNFEGGCYAKCVNLSKEKEPQIFNAIRFGALVENVEFYDGTTTVDYENISKTENTRAAYPIDHIDNSIEPSIAGTPRNIFFLTCDAFGVLPPISKLDTGQAMYHFISGYTAKVAGTEIGITEPATTFSACFGKAFLPLHPTNYAELLGEKLKKNKVNVWLVNTGWSGGSYGVGSRIKLSFTRAMITAALNGDLEKVNYEAMPVFGLAMPKSCPGVPVEILNPRNTWGDPNEYDAKMNTLAASFVKNFTQYSDFANEEILNAAPKLTVNA